MTAASPLPEARLLHEIAPDSRVCHYFRKRSDFKPGDPSYYECACGAQADRFRNPIAEPAPSPWAWLKKKG